ncbi:MAG: VOC family protein [Acetobacteraceae bacterium]
MPAASEPIRIGGVALVVRDLDRVERFYRDVVGLERIDRSGDMARMGAGDAAFLDLLHRPDAPERDPAAAGLYHTAFLLPSRDDLGRWLAHAAAHGTRLDGAADHLVSEALYLQDPEGNGVEIYADRPRSEWTWTATPDGRRISMANDRIDRDSLLALATDAWRGAPAGTHIGHVHLQVGDVGEAARFYGGQLGLDVTASWPQAVFMSSGGYHHHLAANTWHSAGAGPRDPSRAGLASITILAGPAELARIGEASGLADPWNIPLHVVAA